MTETDQPQRWHARPRMLKLIIYRVSSDTVGWRIERNRLCGVTIGAAVVLRHWCMSLVWARAVR